MSLPDDEAPPSCSDGSDYEIPPPQQKAKLGSLKKKHAKAGSKKAEPSAAAGSVEDFDLASWLSTLDLAEYDHVLETLLTFEATTLPVLVKLSLAHLDEMGIVKDKIKLKAACLKAAGSLSPMAAVTPAASKVSITKITGASPSAAGGPPPPLPAGAAFAASAADEPPPSSKRIVPAGVGAVGDMEPTDNVVPIAGVFSDANPLTTLEVAVTFAISRDKQTEFRLKANFFDQKTATDLVNVCMYFAKRLKDNPKHAKFLVAKGLTPNEIAAIHLYTNESGFFKALNQCLRLKQREFVKPFFPYLRLFITALRKLPPYQGALLNRGVNGDLSKLYPLKSSFVDWAFSSFTTDVSIFEKNPQFFAAQGDRTLFQLSPIGLLCGVDIAMFSAFAEESEVLLLPGFTFKVVSALKTGAGVASAGSSKAAHIVIITLQQDTEAPPLMLGMPPQPGTTPTKGVAPATTSAVVACPGYVRKSLLSSACKNCSKSADYHKARDLVRQGCLLQARGEVKAAYDCFTKAEALGSVAAIGLLAEAHYSGRGVRLDYPRAWTLAQRGTKLNDALSLSVASRCLMWGRGTAKDIPQGRALLAEAWQLGVGDALCYASGYDYGEGVGVEKDPQRALASVNRGVDLDNPACMARLAICYRKAKGVEKDCSRGIELYSRAASLGHLFAICNLGCCYCDGEGVPRDFRRANELFQRAADLGDDDALNSLGLSYFKGRGVPKDHARAAYHYQQAADLGNASALWNLALCYRDGTGVSQDDARAAEFYQRAVDLGHFGAMNALGICYENGRGVAQDHAKAVALYQQAIEGGHTLAFTNLAHCYLDGTGVPADLARGVALLQRAADLGNAGALNSLGVCYRQGTGVPKDPVRAAALYQQSADLGNTIAMQNLAHCYLDGKGVDQDPERAEGLFRRAADLFQQGVDREEPAAMNSLGKCYYDGLGVAKDRKRAAALYQQAADLGNKLAMKNLADCYLHGKGVAKDGERARLYLQIYLGNEDSAAARAALAKLPKA